MNYLDTKLLHIFAVIAMFLSITVTLYQPDKKFHKIFSGILSLLVLGSGFMLLRRFGISHSGPFPAWVLIKMGIWLAVTIISPIVVKRFQNVAKILFWPWLIVIFVALYMVIYKPM